MQTLDLKNGSDEFNRLFAAAKKTMFKVEVLQDYSAVDDSPSLRAWLNGDIEKSKQIAQEDAGIIAWRQKCLTSPADITRVHVVDEPFTDYLNWEMEIIYRDSLLRNKAEKILLVFSATLLDKQLPSGDFWIFDNKTVLQWEYEQGRGKVVGAKIWESDEDTSYFLNIRDSLLDVARPVS